MRSDAKLPSMLTKLIVSLSKDSQTENAVQLLKKLGIPNPHPDLLWIEPEEGKNLGVKDAKKIREFLSFKPHSASGKAIVVIGADTFSLDAQNSLLKTLEEPPSTASILLTAASEENLLETIRSRVEITRDPSQRKTNEDLNGTVQKLFNSSIEERFQIIEKTEDREGLFGALIAYTAKELPDNPKLLEFAKEVSEAEKFYKHQGNIRTILEYLMLVLDKIQS